jgi:hypothetical protein
MAQTACAKYRTASKSWRKIPNVNQTILKGAKWPKYTKWKLFERLEYIY